MPELIKNVKKVVLFVFATLLVSIGNTYSQFVNDGADITIQSIASIHVQGDFVHQDGFITNMGVIEVGNDWINNGSSNPISDTDGLVNLVGSNQMIDGTAGSTFNVLALSGQGTKTLVQDIQVNSVLDLQDATLELNEQRLTLDNDANTAISRGAGWIISESTTDLGRLQWNIGEATGQYTVPFGDASSYFPIEFDVAANGVSDGSFSFATYHTNVDNQPLPSGVLNLDVNGEDGALKMVDRFWIIEEDNYMSVPTIDLRFTVNSDDTLSPNMITSDSLKFARWDGSAAWQTFQSTVSADQVETENLNEFGVFTLYSMPNVSSISSVRAPAIDFQSYPNPLQSQSTMTISLESEINSSALATLIDNQGRVVMTSSIPVFVGSNQLELAVPNIPSGLYLLKVDLEGKIGTQKILID